MAPPQGEGVDENGSAGVLENRYDANRVVASPDVCAKASRYAVRVCQEMSKRSTLISDVDDAVPAFEREEVIPYLGDLLGKGGFNNVYELDRIELSTSNALEKQREARDFVAKSKHLKLAVKFLCDEAMTNSDEFCNGAADLLMEAKYLSALAKHYHPCLIQLHGVAAAGATGFAKGYKAGYFLIIDRLYDTLDRKIDIWKEIMRRKKRESDGNSTVTTAASSSAGSDNSNVNSLVENKNAFLSALYLQRVMVGMEISCAIRHLHKLDIIFRDLKPDNVGFDFQGHVKLFDFGLAKELDPLQKTSDGLYKMSGGTGSRRFMAPEVALGDPYGLSADIYSFSILLWEIIALDKAFAYMSSEDHRDKVIKGYERPPQPDDWSASMKYLMSACWNRYQEQRPSAKDVYKALRQEVSYCYEEINQIAKNNENSN